MSARFLVSWAIASGLVPAVFGGEEPSRLGVLLPSDAALAAVMRASADEAIHGYNATSAVPVQLIVRGSPGQWGTEGNEAARLVLDDRVRILIAPPDGTASHQALQVAGRTQTPVISLCGDRSITGAGIPWAVRIGPSTCDQAALLLPRARSWVVVLPAGREGRAVGEDLRHAGEETGVTGLRFVEASELTPLAEGIALAMPTTEDGILLWLPPHRSREWTIRLRESGWVGEIAGPSWLRAPEFTEGNRRSVAGVVVADVVGHADQQSGALARRVGEAIAVALQCLQRAGERPLHTLFPLEDSLGSGSPGGRSFSRFGDQKVVLRLWQWTGSSWSPI